jgi:uncharacterized protein YndB with AHSA1/START domain
VTPTEGPAVRNANTALGVLTLALALTQSAPLVAEVAHGGADGFTVRHSVTTEAEPMVVYRTMTAHIDQWWNPEHSWTGKAANLHMEAERGGCFCERLPGGGFAEHLRIVYLAPGSEIRFDGALGPLQAMAAQGRMIWNIEDLETGSRVTFTYHVFGHPEGGLAGIAPAVDGVIAEQLQRLAERLAWD